MQRKRASSLNALVVEDLILKSRRRIAIPLRLVGLDEDTIGPECARCVGDEKRPPGHDSAIGASRSVLRRKLLRDRCGKSDVLKVWPRPLKEHSPTRNQLPLKTHEENSKNSKTQNPHILGVSMKGALWGNIEKKKICGFGPVRIPAETASRSFRKLEDSFKAVIPRLSRALY